MKLSRLNQALVAVLAMSGCERTKAPATTDSVTRAQAAVAESARAVPAAPAWDPSAGPVLLVAADVPTRAFVLVSDSANPVAALAGIPHPASVTLFGRNGSVQTAELPGLTSSGACVTATLNAAPPPRAWSVGFIGGVVTPLPMDSVESLSRTDSAAVTAELTRLASVLPNDSAGRFTGLPFVVRSVWRFGNASGPQFVAGTLVRQINQEATPLQERTLVVAERSRTDSTLTMAYSERSYGEEETIESREVLAAVSLGTS